MNKVIRWPGLLAFVGFFVVLIALIWLFLGPLVRFGLTTGLTRGNGAEVNIDTVNIQWSPFSMELERIQFTDPETPELNRFQAERVSFSLQLLQAMVGRVHIEELTATGIAMGVERERRGRVRADYLAEREAAGDTMTWGERFTELGFDFPDMDELLERSEIRTPQVIDEVNQRTRQTRADVEQRQDELPESDVLEAYEDRLRALRDARPGSVEEFEQLREQLQSLRNDMRSDRDRVVAFKESVEQAADQVSTDLRTLREAPGLDIERVRQLIELDNDAISDLAGILFGPQVQRWADYALIAYDFVAPMLEREAEATPSRWEGRFIDFDQGNRPVFLIELAHTSLRFAEVDVDLRWDNITWQHERVGSPTTYALSMSQTPYWQSLNADGSLFITEATEFSGSQQWSLQGAELTALSLLEQRDMRIDLAAARLDSTGDIGINQGQFSGGGDVSLAAVELNTTGEQSWTAMLGSALEQINAFSLEIGLGGRIGSPRLDIQSDLGGQLSNALSGVVQTYAAEQLADVRTRLNAEVEEALADLQPQLERVNSLRDLAQNREETLQSLIDQEVDNLRDSAQDEIENRLRDAIRGRFGN